MIHDTALELIRRHDINAELAAAGRALTLVDVQHTIVLMDIADVEDRLGLIEPITWPVKSR